MPRSNRHHGIDFRRDIFAILFLAAGIFFGLCLISYSPSDPALNSVSNVAGVKNLGGLVGAYVADMLFIVFGVSAYLTSVAFFLMSVLQFLGRPIGLRVRQFIYYCLMIAFAASLIHLRFETLAIQGHSISGGGIVGGLLGETLAQYLNRPGAYVILVAGFALFFVLATRLSVSTLVKGVNAGFLWLGNKLFQGACWLGHMAAALARSGFSRLRTRMPGFIARIKSLRKSLWPAGGGSEVYIDPDTRRMSYRRGKKVSDVVSIEPIRPQARARAGALQPQAVADALVQGPRILKRADAKLKRHTEEQLKFQRMAAEGYEPPPLALLDAEERRSVEVDEETLKKNSLLLEKKLKDFDVEGRVIAIHPGPVITMYEYEPSAGTKVNKIVGLQDDLSLTLGGRSVRVVPHLPGKAAVGIEIPNSEREIVWLKNILASPQYNRATTKLPIPLGSSTSGHPIVTDLNKMPHLLIAGATGSGKSVAINSIIMSIIYKSSPIDVRFILVDPKMLELTAYEGIPHLLLPVVTKPKSTVQAMRWAIREMERRYRLMNDASSRHISGYNEKVRKGEVDLVSPEQAAEMLAADKDAATHTGTVPYIVIIIDELADLMMTASQDMEDAVTRLAQMARAAGIHLIVATQRPSVDVITGLIKANFPARIAFKVTSRHDSRTILDGNGAETLLGMGDMLFMTPQGGNLIRIHGSYVTDSDIARVVSHLKQQGEPVYDETITAEPAGAAGAEGFDEDDDELYDQAVALVAETKQASISMVQRRLRIGYNRAARLIERMEIQGVVGPAEGSRPRQVLVGDRS